MCNGNKSNVGRIKKLILPMNTEALPHTPIGGQSSLPTLNSATIGKNLENRLYHQHCIDKNENRKCFSLCHMNIDLFPEINFWQWWHFSNNINIFPALSQKYFCQTFLWFSWKSIQCFHVTLIVAEGLEVIYWICSVWTKHFSVGSSANSASQTFPSSLRQRQKNSGGLAV